MKGSNSWFIFSVLVFILLCSSYLVHNFRFSVIVPDDNLTYDQEKIAPPTLFYDIPVDSFEIVRGNIGRNQNLSEILMDFNVSHQDLHLISQRSSHVYDVRKLKAGSKYAIIHQPDSLKTAKKFIFEPSLTEYVVYHFGDSVYAELFQKEIEVRERSLAAIVTTSVYDAILEKGSTPVLANQLVDIFAWQVDFDRIAKGDQFKILFEEEFVDGKAVGVREIKGVYFKHRDKEYYAIPYNLGDKIEYFDESGKGLRKTFLKYPLKYFDRISSKYSLSRFHPVQKRFKPHLGTDYAARTGTPIRTVGDGVVLEARYHGGNGNYVKIKHNSNYTTQYLHMSKIAKGILPGANVRQGQTIGYVGSTGLATGPHLCFRFWKNGRQVDPLKVDLPSSVDISEAQLVEFKRKGEAIIRQLEAIPYQPDKKLIAESLVTDPQEFQPRSEEN